MSALIYPRRFDFAVVCGGMDKSGTVFIDDSNAGTGGDVDLEQVRRGNLGMKKQSARPGPQPNANVPP